MLSTEVWHQISCIFIHCVKSLNFAFCLCFTLENCLPVFSLFSQKYHLLKEMIRILQSAYLCRRNSSYFNLCIQPHEALAARPCPDSAAQLFRAPKVQVQLVHFDSIHVIPESCTCWSWGAECGTAKAGWVIGIMLRGFNVYEVPWENKTSRKLLMEIRVLNIHNFRFIHNTYNLKSFHFNWFNLQLSIITWHCHYYKWLELNESMKEHLAIQNKKHVKP